LDIDSNSFPNYENGLDLERVSVVLNEKPLSQFSLFKEGVKAR